MNDFFDDFDGEIGWEDFLIIGPLSESLSDEKREKDRLYRDFDDENDIIFDKD